MPSKLEVEIKLRLPTEARGRALLRKAGFELVRRRQLESNAVFDSPDQRLRMAGCLLRVRRHGATRVVTFKEPAVAGRHRSRRETEFEVSDDGAAVRVLEALGLAAVFRYEKYRSEYRGGAGVAMLDHTPIGDFLELEGPPRWIDRTAKALGFLPGDYVTVSYGKLYLEHCLGRGIEPSHMLFQAPNWTLNSRDREGRG